MSVGANVGGGTVSGGKDVVPVIMHFYRALFLKNIFKIKVVHLLTSFRIFKFRDFQMGHSRPLFSLNYVLTSF